MPKTIGIWGNTVQPKLRQWSRYAIADGPDKEIRHENPVIANKGAIAPSKRMGDGR